MIAIDQAAETATEEGEGKASSRTLQFASSVDEDYLYAKTGNKIIRTKGKDWNVSINEVSTP